MIKTILWDFDGVILDSMKIKGDGFIELFKGYSKQDLAKIEKYHYENGGVSRFDKIKYFYNTIVKEEVEDEKILQLANEFSKIIEKNIYCKNNLIQDSVNFIKLNYKNYDFHIVSGAEHIELNNLCKYFLLDKYFISINGSPLSKNILVKNLLKKYMFNSYETILIGDSMSDYYASNESSIEFYGYNNIKLKKIDRYITSFNLFMKDKYE